MPCSSTPIIKHTNNTTVLKPLGNKSTPFFCFLFTISMCHVNAELQKWPSWFYTIIGHNSTCRPLISMISSANVPCKFETNQQKLIGHADQICSQKSYNFFFCYYLYFTKLRNCIFEIICYLCCVVLNCNHCAIPFCFPFKRHPPRLHIEGALRNFKVEFLHHFVALL